MRSGVPVSKMSFTSDGFPAMEVPAQYAPSDETMNTAIATLALDKWDKAQELFTQSGTVQVVTSFTEGAFNTQGFPEASANLTQCLKQMNLIGHTEFSPL
jgi:hypothetical protein